MENQVTGASDYTGNQQPNVSALPKYRIFQSVNDMMGAVKRNLVTFGVTVLVSYILSGVALLLVLYAAAHLLLGQFGLLFASFGKILTVLIVGLIIYTLLYAFVYAFTVSCIAYSLSDEKYGIGTTFKMALRSTLRVVKVSTWVAVVAYWPIAIAIFLPLLIMSSSTSAVEGLATGLLAVVVILAAFIWSIIALLRYSLAPYVALFEPEVPVRQTLKRSEQLLKKGGQWFVIKGVLLILAIFIFLGFVTGSNLRQLENPNDNIISAIFIVLFILVEGAMVMLYLNRSRKQDITTAPKSLRLTVLVLAILIGLLGFAAYNGQKGGQYSDSLSVQEQQELEQQFGDFTRLQKINTLAKALENYYDKNGFYPSSTDLTSPGWASKNLTYTVNKTTLSITDRDLVVSNNELINTPDSESQYKVSLENCIKCASFELSVKRVSGEVYKKVSIHNTVKPSVTTQQQDASSNATPTAQQQPAQPH